MPTSILLERAPSDFNNISHHTLTLQRKRTYILPTMTGLGYATVTFIILLCALNYSNNMAFAFVFLQAGIGFVSMLHTYRNLSGLVIKTSPPKATFAGQKLYLPIQLDNHGTHDRLSITLKRRKTKRYKGESLPVTIDILGQQQKHFHYPIPTSKRGAIEHIQLVISTHFPMGLFTTWAYLDINEYCLIYPSPRGSKRFPKTYQQEIGKNNMGFSKLEGEDIEGFRPYRPGDRINIIAWRAFAKGQELLVKQFSSTSGGKVVFDLKSAATAHKGLEANLSQLALWLVLADQKNLIYGLSMPNKFIKPSSGAPHLHQCLKALALFA